MSRILVIGGSGRTGSLVINEALERGHTVTAIVRNPSAVKARTGLTVVKGSPLVKEDIEKAYATRSDLPTSVIITLANSRSPTTPPRLMADSVANTVAVMQQHSVKKIVIMSSFGTAESRPNMIFPMRWAIQHTGLSVSYADHDMVDKEVKETNFDFVLARPNRLTDGPKVPVRVFDDAGKQMGGFMSISRASVANFLVDAVEKDTWKRQTPTIAN